MYSELWQLGGMLAFFAVALVLWLRIVYLPGRTLERWEDQRVKAREKPRRPEPAPVEGRGSRNPPEG